MGFNFSLDNYCLHLRKEICICGDLVLNVNFPVYVKLTSTLGLNLYMCRFMHCIYLNVVLQLNSKIPISKGLKMCSK